MTYFDELCRAMEMLAEHPRSIFLGQAVADKGTGMSASFAKVPREKLLELPVFEDTQLGMSIGLAIAGELPVSIFPRWNFLLCAMNQLVSHLDRLPLYSTFTPKVIIRTAVGTRDPMDPGPQHLGEFSGAFRQILKTVRVVNLFWRDMIADEYAQALEGKGSTILVEYPEKYHEGE